MAEWFNQLMVDRPLVRILDIAIIWYIVYRLLLYARGARAMNLLKGVGIVIVAKFVSSMVGLTTIDWLLGQIISWGVVATVILFQPELRRALETLGRSLSRATRKGVDVHHPAEQMINDLDRSIWYMSRRKIGALISIEREDSLQEYIQTGIEMDSLVTNQLLVNIFIPNTPLHDGAVIISDYRITAAACYLPLSGSQQIPKELGTRHRAAIGLSEVSDAVTIVVSEETGDVSVAMRDHLHRKVTPDTLKELLSHHLIVSDKQETKDNFHSIKELLVFFKSRGER